MNKIEKIRNKYYNTIHKSKFYEIISSDPTTFKKNEIPVKLGKYSQWLLKIYKEKKLLLEDLYKANEYLKGFHSLKEKNLIPLEQRDILKYNSLQQVFSVTNKIIGNNNVKDNKEIKFIADRTLIDSGEATLFYEDEKCLIVIPETLKSSKFYGEKSHWCTTMGSNFNYYNRKGKLYIIIFKSKLGETSLPSRRLQFHFETEQFMNLNDFSINIYSFFKNNPNIFLAFSKNNEENIKEIMMLLENNKIININKIKLASYCLKKEETLDLLMKLYNSKNKNIFKNFLNNPHCLQTTFYKKLTNNLFKIFKKTPKKLRVNNSVFLQRLIMPYGKKEQIEYFIKNSLFKKTKENESLFQEIFEKYSSNIREVIIKNKFDFIKPIIINGWTNNNYLTYQMRKKIANNFFREKKFIHFLSSGDEALRFLSKKQISTITEFLLEENRTCDSKIIFNNMSDDMLNKYFENTFSGFSLPHTFPIKKLTKENLNKLIYSKLKTYFLFKNREFSERLIQFIPSNKRYILYHIKAIHIKNNKTPISYSLSINEQQNLLRHNLIKLKKDKKNMNVLHSVKPLTMKEIKFLGLTKQESRLIKQK
jgi:hypothetical protein